MSPTVEGLMKKQVSPSSAMNSRRRNVSESPQTILRRSSRLIATDELLLNIPIDLIIEIFSRLPLKSIARCSCVSKRWASVIRLPDFTELFFTKSLARPQLLLACWEEDKKKEVMVFSIPHPQNLDEEDSSHITAVDHHMTFPFQDIYYIFNHISGLLCISDDRMLKGRKTSEVVWVICNPSTGQYLTLPKMKTRKRTGMTGYLGYDPVEKQHKVLGMTDMLGKSVVEHQVLTLRGDGNLTWRLIECGTPHYDPGPDYICINGVLYYIAIASNGDNMVVCFDVRSEKYSFTIMERGMLPAALKNFQGKLALVRSSGSSFFCGTSTSLEMWILEDPEKHEWFKRIFSLPPMWKDAPAKEFLQFVGVTATNEFVFAHPFPSDAFHVYYYNFVKEAITRVEIQGMGVFEKVNRVHIFVNHVEDVKLM